MRSIISSAAIGIVFLTASISAEYPEFDYSNERALPGGGRNNVSLTQPVKHPLKYVHWYTDFSATLELITHTTCNLSFAAYSGNGTAREILGPVQDYCWTHSNCLLATISERAKASFGGTSILLGLAPTTLSVLGPSVAEMALLSLHRPILSLLLSLGAPAVFPGRFLLWDDPLRADEPATGAFIVRAFSPKWAIAVSIIQYLVALCACGNIFHAVYWIGIKGVLSWRCATSYWPLLWVVMSLVIHSTATISLRTAIHRKKIVDIPQQSTPTGSTENKSISPDIEETNSSGEKVGKLRRGGFMGMLRNEVLPSANSDWQVRDLYDVRLGPLPVILQYTGAFMAVCHLVFGTLLFSSLLFIAVGEGMELVLRLIASATVCRIVLQFEVGGMIRVGEDRVVYRGIVQPEDTKKEQ
jgi:hypothetical protein